MADNSAIEWTDAAWSSIRARYWEIQDDGGGKERIGWHCTHVSEGCRNCYAERINRRLGTGRDYAPDELYREENKWRRNGEVKLFLDEKMLTQPLRWKKPRRIFVCSMTDLFVDGVADEWIDRVFAVMALCPQHTYQCLTKRARRMRDYISAPDRPYRIAQAMDAVLVDRDHGSDPGERWAEIPNYDGYEASTHGRVRSRRGDLSTYDNELLGREQVTLWNGGEPRTWFIHALVLMAHRGMPADSFEARHRNGNKADNRLANLLWGSRSENQNDKVRHGSLGGPQKLTLAQVAEIRAARLAGETQQSIADRFGVSRSLISMIDTGEAWPPPIEWPLRQVWLGVSVEDQERADERIPLLLDTPAAKRFISAEPLLGPIDLRNLRANTYDAITGCGDMERLTDWGSEPSTRLDWVIAGGESGPGARPMHPEWARKLRGDCVLAGVPFFFKQWGEYAPLDNFAAAGPDDGSLTEDDRRAVYRVGKKAAGRLLDGRTWDEFPA